MTSKMSSQQPMSQSLPVSPRPRQSTTPIVHLPCVCELCTCGKHHCPKPKLKGILQTSYNDHYKEYEIQGNVTPRGPYQYEMRKYNPDHLKSNYQETYIKKEMPQEATQGRFENIAKQMILSPNRIKFNASTAYAEHYKEYPIEKKTQQQLPLREMYSNQVTPKPIKFQGTSSYKSSYTSPPKPQPKRTLIDYPRAQIPFSGESTYKNHYIGHKIDPSPLIQSVIEATLCRSPTKFNGKSSYKEHYDGKYLPKSELPCHQACICETMNIPTVNLQDKPHLRYNILRGEWI